jgi:ribosome-associated translation inhibitor RaiA
MELKLTRLPDKQEVIIFADAVVGVTPLPTAKAIGVIVLGGGTIPVEGTQESVLAAIRAARNQGKDLINGISKRRKTKHD